MAAQQCVYMEESLVVLTEIITLAGVAGTIGILLNLQYRLHRDIDSLRQDMNKETSALRERMAKIEGLFEGFVNRKKVRAES